MKSFLLATLVLIAGCSGCATTHPPFSIWGNTDDQGALFNQRLMRQTVQVLQILNVITPESKTKGLGHLPEFGTGSIVASDIRAQESLVLTAGHVCVTPESHKTRLAEDGDPVELPVISSTYKIQDIEGVWHDATVQSLDMSHDLCVLRIRKFVGPVAEVTSSMPPLGALLLNPSAPARTFMKWTVPVFEGYFSGFWKFKDMDEGDAMLVTSIPAMGGASGSGVYYQGKIIGILTRVDSEFSHITYLVHAGHVVDILAEAKKNWLSSLKSTSPSPK